MATPDPTPFKLARHIGQCARAARARTGLTQADVAEMIGLATEVYGRLERGLMLPSARSLRKLCRALALDANAMLGLATQETASRLDATERTEREPPALRRLVRQVRKLAPSQLKALGSVCRVLLESPPKHKPRRRKPPTRQPPQTRHRR